MCSGLYATAYLAVCGVVHRDLKCHNVLLTSPAWHANTAGGGRDGGGGFGGGRDGGGGRGGRGGGAFPLIPFCSWCICAHTHRLLLPGLATHSLTVCS